MNARIKDRDWVIRAIEKSTVASCWIFNGARDLKGYGVIRIDGVQHRLSRVSYSRFVGQIPEGMFVCHRCDTPACWNPAHLFAATHNENMADMVRKGRQARVKGQDANSAKLTNEQAVKIKEMILAGRKQMTLLLNSAYAGAMSEASKLARFGLTLKAATRMVSKSQRLKSKRISRAGRPRKEGVERYPSGDVKRSETQKEVMSVAIEARGRVHGHETNDPRIGYVLGRIRLDGKISDEQLEAGNEFSLAIARYHMATGIAFPSARAQDIFRVQGKEGEVTEEMASRARNAANRMMELRGVLLQCIDGPQVMSTVWNVCIMDYDHLRGMSDQQILWLKRGLIALIRHKDLRAQGKSATKVGIFNTEKFVA